MIAKWKKELYFGRVDNDKRKKNIDEIFKLKPDSDWVSINQLSNDAIGKLLLKLKRK